MSTNPVVSLRILLPENIFQEYEKQAKEFPLQSLEEFISDRLIRYKDSRSNKTLTIEDPDRRELEQHFRINIPDSKRLVSEIKRALTIKVGPLDIVLPERLLERLRSRAIRVDFDIFLRDLVIRSLEEHVGMR